MSLSILSPLSFITGSSASTPTSGFGNIYASGSFLYYKNDAGTEYNLTQGRTNILYYTASATYTKPTNLSELLVVAIAAGGGGGSGRLSAASTGSSGGAGGGGSAITYRRFKTSTDLTGSTYSITVGGGGIGGVPQNTNSTNGNAGSAGTATTFTTASTTLVNVGAPLSGNGGTTTLIAAGLATQGVACTPAGGPYSYSATNAGIGQSTQAGGAGASAFNLSAMAGGGGGGGINASNAVFAGGAGGAMYVTGSNQGGTTAGPITPPYSSSAGRSNGKPDVLFLFSTTEATFSPGFSGAGGAGVTGSNAGSGSAGGNYGAGGGGGGGGRDTFLSGGGGKGGDGLMILLEYY